MHPAVWAGDSEIRLGVGFRVEQMHPAVWAGGSEIRLGVGFRVEQMHPAEPPIPQTTDNPSI